MRSPLRQMYQRMKRHYGSTGWWPGDSPFEIAVGAILTQNTAWSNVEKAIVNLKREKLLSPKLILDCSDAKLENALRPSGYFRIKAGRLRNFCQYLSRRYQGSMSRMARRPLNELREELLEIKGVGPETADDILLYACEKPSFVIDAYTRRILSRHGLVDAAIRYDDLQKIFHTNLRADVRVFKEFHGLLVHTAKEFCKTHPQCEGCPLQPMLGMGDTI